ncbi:MAG: hypothetical protein L7S45_00340, partial [Luminiphilus sp.]|nr:hypothetical protein [Luminiphilus sp.]
MRHSRVGIVLIDIVALVVGLGLVGTASAMDPVEEDTEIGRSFTSTLIGALSTRVAPEEEDLSCPDDQWASGTYSMSRAGFTRRFRVHVPAGYDPSVRTPLIIAFHGWGDNEDAFLDNAAVRSNLDQT